MGQLREVTRKLAEAKTAVLDSSRPKAVARQHAQGKLTARERLGRLFDAESFVEWGALGAPAGLSVDGEAGAADGVVVGYGRIAGRTVCGVSYDFTVFGGSMGSVNDAKMGRIRKFALEYGYPLLFLLEGGGARVQERMGSQATRGHDRFFDLALMSGWVPIGAAVLGPTFAGHANLAALADFVVMREGASLGMAGPPLVRAAVGEDVSPEELGGAEIHGLKTGMVDRVVQTEEEAIQMLRRFLSYLPDNASQSPPVGPPVGDLTMGDAVLDVVPRVPYQPYDMHRIVDAICDPGSILELKPTFARNLITALARINGYPVGVVANNPAVAAGMMNTPASDKMAHFISFCDAFGLPLVFVVDVPGYMVGVQSELSGIVRHSMKPLFELGQATVPRLTVLVRKAYGLAYHAMGAAEFEPDLIVAWPSAEVSPMGPEGAANVIIAGSADDPAIRRERARLVAEFREQARPWRAAEEMRLDDVIDPRETRARLAHALKRLWGRPRHTRHRPPKKHGICPI